MLRFISFLFFIMKFFDTFSGIGGFALPLTELGHECVGFSEIDKYATQVYRSHFPSHTPYGDITRLDPAALPDFDLLVGGFPCQSFSVAGKRRGFLDTRGTLFFDVCRVAKEKRPRLLLLENVKGLLNHAGGDTFRVILSALDELGYDADWQVCNSRHFGVPQNRERVFVVGHLRGQPGPEVFPIAEGEDELADTNGEVAGVPVPPVTCQGGRNLRGAFIGRWVNKQVGVTLDDDAPTLRASGGTDIRKMPVVISVALRGREQGTELEARSDDVANALRTASGGSSKPLVMYPGHAVNEPDGVARTLKAGVHGVPGGEGLVRDGLAIRRLTPLECERLQGFPDGWTVGLSDTRRYKCLGNAVTVNVVREVVKRLTPEQDGKTA